MKKLKPDTLNNLGIQSPEHLAARTIARITYNAQNTGDDIHNTTPMVIENSLELISKDSEEQYAERILAGQIQVLNAFFNRQMQFAATVIEKNPELAESFAYLALRAAKEVRESIATLQELKHPRPRKTIFVKNQQNNLITGGENAALDSRSQREAETSDRTLEAVDALYRGAD